MPINYVYSGTPLNGTATDDFILGYGPNSGDDTTINGDAGDDLIIADTSNAFVPTSGVANNDIASAQSLETSPDAWTTDENPFFGDSSIPHVSAYVDATVGQAEYFSVTVGAGETLTVDIDFGNSNPIGDSDDVVVEIRDAMGTILASNDDGGTLAGGLGSTSSFDSYLSYVAPGAGTYYIVVRPFGAATFPAAATFVMNVSVTNHAVGAPTVMGNDTIDAGDGDDTVAGQGGDDTINGGIGNDTLIGGTGNDTINGGDGNDIIYAGRNDSDYELLNSTDVIHGDGGNDTIYSAGEGHYYGDAGDDFMVAGLSDSADEVMDGGTGIDTLDLSRWNGPYVLNMFTGATNYSNELYTNFENVIFGNGNDTLNANNAANQIFTSGGDDSILGRSGNDTINAGEGNNFINGGTGADVMIAGSGDDDFVVDNVGDTVTDAGGDDTVRSVISYSLGAGLERLVLMSTTNINATGNELNNFLWGNIGANVLDGGLGADIMRGGQGDDTYIVDNAGDRVVETGSANGHDTVYSSINYVLPERIEQLVLTGIDNLSGNGSSTANEIYGNSGNNVLNGRGGDDTIYGGDGDDIIRGGTGRDTMTGGLGADKFIFDDGDFGSPSERIMDFSHAENDRIQLNLVDANSLAGGDQAFSFIGTSGFHNVAGELRYQQISGNTYVYGDTNGDGTADFVIRLDGLVNLVGGDFVL